MFRFTNPVRHFVRCLEEKGAFDVDLTRFSFEVDSLYRMGKTETAKVFAKLMFGARDRMTRYLEEPKKELGNDGDGMFHPDWSYPHHPDCGSWGDECRYIDTRHHSDNDSLNMYISGKTGDCDGMKKPRRRRDRGTGYLYNPRTPSARTVPGHKHPMVFRQYPGEWVPCPSCQYSERNFGMRFNGRCRSHQNVMNEAGEFPGDHYQWWPDWHWMPTEDDLDSSGDHWEEEEWGWHWDPECDPDTRWVYNSRRVLRLVGSEESRDCSS